MVLHIHLLILLHFQSFALRCLSRLHYEIVLNVADGLYFYFATFNLLTIRLRRIELGLETA